MNLANTFQFLFVFYIMYSQKIKVKAFVNVNTTNGIVIMAMENEYVNIECKSRKTPVAYCGFLHPNGQRWSFTVNNADTYNCTREIKMSKFDVGPWRCYIGTRRLGQEVSLSVRLRLVNELSAVEPNVYAALNADVLLLCVPTKKLVPVTYCRFEPPQALPFRIDSSVNKRNAIENKYYYPLGMSLNKGDCAVRIMHVNKDDEGIWTCSVGVDNQHYSDYVKLHITNNSYTSVYISVIAVVLGLGFIGSVALIAVKHPSVLGTHQSIRYAAEEADFQAHASIRSIRSVSSLNRL